jgi:superfamily I DNA/RNA helicase/RecB family exonuclease
VLDAAAAGRIPTSRLAAGGPGEDAAASRVQLDQQAAHRRRLRGRRAPTSPIAGRGLIASPPEDWDARALDAQRARLAAFDEAVGVYERFESSCSDRGLATFDDYILLPIRILRESASAAAIIRDETRHLVVDEYQDVNGAQLELLRLLAPPNASADICVVGDDDQAIYGFRGSDTRAFDHFAQIWTDSTTITLDANYRSTPAIVGGSQRIIARAQTRFVADKSLEARGTHADDASPIEAVHVDKQTPWGGVIAPMILADRAESGRGFDAYAVIASTHGKLEEIADQLSLAGIPVSRSRRASALDDDAVQDLLEWVRLLVEGQGYSATRLLTRPPIRMPRDEAMRLRRDYHRVVARAKADGSEPPAFMAWVRESSDERVQTLVALYDKLTSVAANAPAHEAVAAIIEQPGLAHAELLPARERAVRVAHLVAVLRFARELGPRLAPPGDLGAFWDHYQRLDPADQTFRGMSSIDGDAEAEFEGTGVRLLTAHQSKGLEFDTVFVPNIGTGPGQLGRVQPSDRPELPPELTGDTATPARDELRRLFYVAMTRAERRLVLMAHPAASRSKSLHMFQELAWRGTHPLPTDEPEDGVLLRSDADVLRDAAAVGISTTIDALDAESAHDPDHRRRVLAAARRTARLQAAEALESADNDGLTEAMLDAQKDRLEQAAAWMAAIARLERGDSAADLPGWLAGSDTLAQRARELADQLAASGEPDTEARGLRPPLHLSYSQIDAYRRCPACYHVKHVLGLVDAPTSAQVVGTVAHGSLERFYRAWSEADNEGNPKPTKADLLRTGRDLFFEASARVGGVDRGQLAQIEAQLDAGYDAFHDDNAEIVMIEEKLLLKYERPEGDDEPHTIEAKIDRVERSADGEGFRIVDYKTGGAWKSLVEPKADDLQLGIYALALADAYGLDAGELSGEAAYWLLSTQQAGTIALHELDLDGIRAVIDDTITGMLEGRFGRGKKCDGTCAMFQPAASQP